MPKPTFSFILVNYRSAACLEKALESLQVSAAGLPHEIILVNNDASEREQVMQIGQRFGSLVESLPANFGFGRANNVGAAKASGEILVFLNPDTRFQSGKWGSLEALLQHSPRGVVGLRLLASVGVPELWSCGQQPTLWSLLFQKIKFFFVETPWDKGRVTRVDWVSGAALAIRREFFQAIGGFDETFFLYYEDVDLCLRAKALGGEVLFFPFLSLLHERGQSHASHQSMKDQYFAGQKKYFAKHRTSPENIFLSFLQPLYRLFCR